MNCGKILSTWNIGSMYWIKLIFTLTFYIIGAILIIISLHFILGVIIGIFLIVIGLIYGSFPLEFGTPGKNTIYAKLFQNCYMGYTAPLSYSKVSIDFSKKPKLLLVRYTYYFSSGIFLPLDSPWQGWNLIFIYDGKIAWGPNVSTVTYFRKDHVFMGSVVMRFRELGLDVGYTSLDPQYMEIFIRRLNSISNKNDTIDEILLKIGINEYGEILDERPEKIYELPHNLQRVKITRKYEEILPDILSKP